MQSSISASRLRSTIFAFALVFACSATALETASTWEQDLEVFRSNVFEPDKSFSEEEREKGEHLLSRLEEEHDQLSPAQIELALAEISAITNNGHSFLMPGGWTDRYKQLPLRFHVFADGIYIISAGDGYTELVGQKLVSIDGQTSNQLRESWKKYQGGLDGWRDVYLPYFLETPVMLNAAGLNTRVDSVTLKLADASGKFTEIEITASSDQPPLEGIDQYLAPSRLLRGAIQSQQDQLPLYLQQAQQTFRYDFIEDINAAYIQFKANTDYSGEQNIDAFLDSVSGFLRKNKPANIIVDQRFNFGGDLNITRELMQKIPGYLDTDGKVYIITSGRTFSAAISSMGYLKQVAGDRAVIVGEPVGDALEFWAEGDLQVLPNSGVAFLMATERHNYMTGCPEKDCHGSIRRHPIKVPTLAPDSLVALTWSDYERGIDPALEEIRTMISRNP